MSISKCPECKSTINNAGMACSNCGFDIPEFVKTYERILKQKIQEDRLNPERQKPVERPVEKVVYRAPVEDNVPRCPTCRSKNIKRISGLSKAGSVAMWGVFAAGKVSKQWHCNNCKHEW